MAAPGFIATMRAAAKALNTVIPQRISQPVLVIWGERDRILPVAGGRSLAAAIPQSQFESLSGVAHCPMIEAPDRFDHLIVGFVNYVLGMAEEPADGA
jgi:pimeloyl-ACP methyl ester carboxylesterase